MPIESSRPLSVAVFCGSRTGHKPIYAEVAAQVGRFLAEQDVRVVYGGGGAGLMRVVADSALAAGGQVLGIIPEALEQLEHAHRGLSELRVVATMRERKAQMAAESDAFISLAGGIGTLEELAEMWTLNMLGYQHKPMALLNTEGYYDDLARYFEGVVAQGFADAQPMALLRMGTEPIALLQELLAQIKP